ncbi:DUF2306 domain-containing protein [Lacisediminimonas profundi]|uniref:DUF2306 domain-containing protein n=1 Tax=Lacisediminimonas profundi TaxID=2603856 RepID=UPI0013871EB6|nr:DUF2306 domain-containing protein [Lacisediminimonas profundi]
MLASPVVLVHLATALLALIIGTITLFLKKGTPVHKLAGRSWVLLMVVTALVSFAIRSSGHFSWIHIFSVTVLVVLARAVHAIMRGKLKSHQRGMVGAYIGLVGAAVFTLLPNRLLGQWVWGSLGLV